ncbi:MAG: hypothetical protein PHX12_09315, partial [Proteiniphilum sp.]|nr:hypothetical protein [Proteiniphilum sp.]
RLLNFYADFPSKNENIKGVYSPAHEMKADMIIIGEGIRGCDSSTSLLSHRVKCYYEGGEGTLCLLFIDLWALAANQNHYGRYV